MRVKNMFLENSREGLGLYSYADIKMSVLVEMGQFSMSCEVQFLMKWMAEAKAMGHSLYSIQRRNEAVRNVKIFSSLYRVSPIL